jgi:hypothetical protein
MNQELDLSNVNATDEELLSDIRRVANLIGKKTLQPVEYKEHGKYFISLILGRFPNWNKALEDAGLKKVVKNGVPDEDILNDMKRVGAIVKKDVISKEDYRMYGDFGVSVIFNRFETWEKALILSGFKKSSEKDKKIRDLMENLEDVWISLGRSPRFIEIRTPFSKFNGTQYIATFGGWHTSLDLFEEYIAAVKVDSEASIKDKPTLENGHKTLPAINRQTRFSVMKRSGFKCSVCKNNSMTNPGVLLEVEHIVPFNNGGETVDENLHVICTECKKQKEA